MAHAVARGVDAVFVGDLRHEEGRTVHLSSVGERRRVEITGYKNGTNGFITFVFLDLDPDVCTAIKVQELPVVCTDLWDSGNDDFDTLNNKVEDTSSNYHPVFTGIGSDEKRLGIKQKDAGFCYYFR